MKKILFPLVLLILTIGCASSGSSIEERAVQLVSKHYTDVKEILSVAVDTVTLGDNLAFRMEKARSNAMLFSRLDSLRRATLDKANEPAAFEVSVAYNQPANIVWLQMSPSGELLKMSKNKSDLFLNPGEDMPGYLEIVLDRE